MCGGEGSEQSAGEGSEQSAGGVERSAVSRVLGLWRGAQ